MHIYKLSSDYLQIISLEKVLWAGQKREAPCLFKRNGYYILLTSAATGWNPNQAKYGYTTSITGTWSNLINIGNSTTYDSQPAYVSTITGTSGTSYLYMGDRWAGAWQGKVNDSRYVWAPLKFNSDTSMSMNYFDCISVDTQTGDIDSSNDIVTINDSVTGSSNHQFDYNGTWSSSSQKGAHDNNNHWSSNPNSYYEIDFYGTKAKVYAAMASNHGIAAISIDGGPEISVDYFRAIRNECTLVYSSPILSLGLHTLKVRVTGNKNASSTAGAIPADRVDIYR
jgi:hypothetical protein